MLNKHCRRGNKEEELGTPKENESCYKLNYRSTIWSGALIINIYTYHRRLAGGTKYCTRVRVQYFICPRGR